MERQISVAIAGTGSAVPSRVVLNSAVCHEPTRAEDWVWTRTGIKERRFAASHETAATLGSDAARSALDMAAMSAQQIDLIICGTVTPSAMAPSTACMIQSVLGCRSIPAFDLSAACTGFVYALATAYGFIQSGMAQTALVIGSEILSRVIDPDDSDTAILFGDAAGAVVLKAVQNSSQGLHSFHLGADGKRQELIHLPGPGSIPGTSRFVRMSGKEVFRFALGQLTEMVQQALVDCKKHCTQLSLVIPHQVNVRMVNAAAEMSGFPRDRFITTLDRYANTAAASVPVALDEAVRTGRCSRGDTVLLAAFGGGLTWGSALVTL